MESLHMNFHDSFFFFQFIDQKDQNLLTWLFFYYLNLERITKAKCPKD